MTGCLVRKLRFLCECSSDHTQVKREEIMLTTCLWDGAGSSTLGSRCSVTVIAAFLRKLPCMFFRHLVIFPLKLKKKKGGSQKQG